MPLALYNFRFAAINEVGMGLWSAEESFKTPKISPPEAPEILNFRTEGSDVIQSNFDTKIEVKWKIPADNGERIYAYQIKYCEVKIFFFFRFKIVFATSKIVNFVRFGLD